MLHLSPPWLSLDLGQDMQVLSWAPHNGGLTRTSRILWREVRDSDLTADLDPHAWLAEELAARGAGDAVCFLTSRTLGAAVHRKAEAGEVTAEAVATVGLSNAERVGTRLDRVGNGLGTINVALKLGCGLTSGGLLEALSIVAEARTAAVMDAGHDLSTGRATGTGTDCIAVAAPDGPLPYAGLHTDCGLAAGRAVYEAVRRGAEDWLRERPGAAHMSRSV